MRQRFWELGGSRMGEAMGIKADNIEGEDATVKKEEQDGEYDYRKENKFSDHLKEMKKEVRAWTQLSRSYAGTSWILKHL
jgi:pre-mRNA-splicing factor ATP-dependent RNA helicase DHX38/PRP16